MMPRGPVGHDNTSTRRRSCRVSMLLYTGCWHWRFCIPCDHPPSSYYYFFPFFFFFSFTFFRNCTLRAKSLSSLVTIRRTDERRTQTLTRDQRNGIRDLALFPFLRTLSSFYVRFMCYVSVLHLTLTSFRFRDERRQRGERVTYARTSRPPPSAVEEPPSRSRAVFHPSSSFHYPILWAFSCHSYHHYLRSTFHFCTRSTFPLVGCFALARADSMTAFDDQT